MKLTVLGCSDAFGSGGRLQTSFHVSAWGTEFLIDCGATTLLGLERERIDPNGVKAIFISHLHGDHFGGLIWWLIHANHVAGRLAPLTITGPEGLESRFVTAAEALFPGSTKTRRQFDLKFIEYREQKPLEVEGVKVTPFEVSHPSGAPPYALRLEVEGKTVAFSGDTEWADSLVPAAQKADLFITECSAFDQEARYHLNWTTIEHNLDRLGARRYLLSHMGRAMLANRHKVKDPRVLLAEDGMKLDI